MRNAPLVWMVGLPGAGKTSLAAQTLYQAQIDGEQPVWYRLDEEDVDVAGVFDALRHSADPELRTRLPAWSPDHQPELRSFSRRFFGTLASAGMLNIVFDDCHRIGETGLFFEMLDAAREVLGDGLHLLLISRRPPPPQLARGQVAGWLTVFDDLKLSLDEASEIAQKVAGRALSPAQTERLQQAQGWMAHVMALSQSSELDDVPPPPGAAALVGDYLANELLLMMPADQRAAFRRLAELPEIPRRLLIAGRVAPQTGRLLDDLGRRRYFVEYGAAAAWRMHDLLRDGLRAINNATDTPAELAAARRELARWIAAEAPETAMNLLVAAGDVDEAVTLLAHRGQGWLERGRHRQILGWIAALLPDESDGGSVRASLLLWQAEALLPLEPEQARPLFAECRLLFAAQRDAGLACRAWCGEVGSYVVQWGAVQGLAERVDVLEALIAELGAPPGEWAFRTAADALTALMYGRPEDPRLLRYALATSQALDQAPDADSRIAAAGQLLIYKLWWAGDFPGGRALYNSFDAAAEAGTGLSSLARLIWWSNAAIVDWQCGDPARCYDKVDRGLALAEEAGIHVRDFLLLTQGIFCALSQSDWPRAERYLDRLARTERTHKRLDVMVHHFFCSWYCLSRGDARTALAHAEAALPMAEAMGSSFHLVIVLSALAPARVHCGDLDGAEWAYRQQLALAKAANNPTFSFIAFCAGAELALARKDREALSKQVERILTVKQLGGFHSTCGWRTPMMAEVLSHALEHGIQPAVAQQWIREKRVPPPGRAVPGWPMPVQIAALNGLSVQVFDGEPERTKPPMKLRELLAILVAERDGASQGDLGEWLWPEADGDRAAAALKTAIHRLRLWLGAEAITVRDRNVSLNPLQVGCDLWCWLDRPQLDGASRVLSGFESPPVLALRRRLQQLRGL